jgi:hypothetical protein
LLLSGPNLISSWARALCGKLFFTWKLYIAIRNLKDLNTDCILFTSTLFRLPISFLRLDEMIYYDNMV